MSDSVATQQAAGARPDERREPGRWTRLLVRLRVVRPPAPTFAELVWLHRRWREELDRGGRSFVRHDARWQEALAAFEREHGPILSAYWCSRVDSAAALTERPSRLPRVLRRRRLCFHRVSDWATKEHGEAARLLHRCDVTAIKASEVLRGATHRICLRLVMAAAGQLLALVDEPARPDRRVDVRRGLDAAQGTVADAEAYYREMSLRESQIIYVFGMVLGLAVVAGGALGVWQLGEWGGKDFLACAVAGALGGIASVLQRMNSGGDEKPFELDPELGRNSLYVFGATRSFLGALFGLTLYFALISNFVNIRLGNDDSQAQVFLYALISFAGGFSERLAKDVIDAAEKTVAEAVQEDRREDVEAPTPRPTPG